LGGGHSIPDYYDDDDEDGTDFELADDYFPGDGLVWPCDACVPNNRTGYTCPTPLPAPTPAEIQAEQAHRPTWAPVGAPVRGNRRTPLYSAIANGM